MQIDSIQQFTKLRNSLVAERGQLEKRLSQLNSLLGGGSEPGSQQSPKGVRGKGRGRNGLSLKAAILQATAKKALTKEEILAAVKKAGYKFATKRPIATLNAYLYQKGSFLRRDGRFTAAKTVGSAAR
jgi:hypothetical protein